MPNVLISLNQEGRRQPAHVVENLARIGFRLSQCLPLLGVVTGSFSGSIERLRSVKGVARVALDDNSFEAKLPTKVLTASPEFVLD